MVQEAKMSSNCDKNIMKQSTTFIKKPIGKRQNSRNLILSEKML